MRGKKERYFFKLPVGDYCFTTDGCIHSYDKFTILRDIPYTKDDNGELVVRLYDNESNSVLTYPVLRLLINEKIGKADNFQISDIIMEHDNTIPCRKLQYVVENYYEDIDLYTIYINDVPFKQIIFEDILPEQYYISEQGIIFSRLTKRFIQRSTGSSDSVYRVRLRTVNNSKVTHSVIRLLYAVWKNTTISYDEAINICNGKFNDIRPINLTKEYRF